MSRKPLENFCCHLAWSKYGVMRWSVGSLDSILITTPWSPLRYIATRRHATRAQEFSAEENHCLSFDDGKHWGGISQQPCILCAYWGGFSDWHLPNFKETDESLAYQVTQRLPTMQEEKGQSQYLTWQPTHHILTGSSAMSSDLRASIAVDCKKNANIYHHRQRRHM